MIIKLLALNFRLGTSKPRPFSELDPYRAFVFHHHIAMQDPYIQIKVSPNTYARLKELITPSCGDPILTIEDDPICYPLI
jgi:hypothetical protein